METLKRTLIKMCSKPMQQIYTQGSLLGRSLISSLHSPSTTPLITLPHFPLLNCKRILQVEFLNDNNFKPEVLKATSFKKEETKLYSKIFVIPSGYLKCCLKMSVLTQF